MAWLTSTGGEAFHTAGSDTQKRRADCIRREWSGAAVPRYFAKLFDVRISDDDLHPPDLNRLVG